MKKNWFTRKPKISDILSNREKGDAVILENVISFCENKKANPSEWDIIFEDRLIVQSQNDKLIISKTEEARRKDFNGFHLAFFAILIITIGLVFSLCFGTESTKFEKFWMILILPFFILVSTIMIYERKIELKEKEKRRFFHFLKSKKVKIIEDGKFVSEHEIKALNIFWKADPEDDGISVLFEAKLENRIGLEIDSNDLNYCELFEVGKELSEFLDLKLNIASGNSPYKKYEFDEINYPPILMKLLNLFSSKKD